MKNRDWVHDIPSGKPEFEPVGATSIKQLNQLNRDAYSRGHSRATDAPQGRDEDWEQKAHQLAQSILEGRVDAAILRNKGLGDPARLADAIRNGRIDLAILANKMGWQDASSQLTASYRGYEIYSRNDGLFVPGTDITGLRSIEEVKRRIDLL